MSNLEQCEATHPERQSPLERWVNRERMSSGVVDSVAGLNEPIETLASGSRLLSDEENGGPRLFSREELPDDRDVYHELEFLRKLKTNEVGEEDELLGSGKAQPVFNNQTGRFFPQQEDAFFKVEVYKDSHTKQLYVRDVATDSLYKLQRTDRFKPEGFAYVYTDLLGNDVGVKMP